MRTTNRTVNTIALRVSTALALSASVALLTAAREAPASEHANAAPTAQANADAHELVTTIGQLIDAAGDVSAHPDVDPAPSKVQHCNDGGTLALTHVRRSAIDPLSIESSLIARDCAVVSNTGRRWIISSDRAMQTTVKGSLDANRNLVHVVVAVNAAFTYESQGMTGRCAWDTRTEYVYRPDHTFVSGGQTTGTVCGHPIAEFQ
jgi:hypothetical protein